MGDGGTQHAQNLDCGDLSPVVAWAMVVSRIRLRAMIHLIAHFLDPQ
jgi:hypothetical protein